MLSNRKVSEETLQMTERCFLKFMKETNPLEHWVKTDNVSFLVAIDLVNHHLMEWGARFELNDPNLPISGDNEATIKFDSEEDLMKFILAWS